jgi:hypothetical protein
MCGPLAQLAERPDEHRGGCGQNNNMTGFIYILLTKTIFTMSVVPQILNED